MVIGPHHFLFVSLLLFVLGLFGVLSRRNLLVMLMSIELMLNAVNLVFVTFSQFYVLLSAQVCAFFVMSIAAAEAGVGLALIVVISRRFKPADLKWLQGNFNNE